MFDGAANHRVRALAKFLERKTRRRATGINCSLCKNIEYVYRPACGYGKTPSAVGMGVCGKKEGRIPGYDAREEVQAFHGGADFSLGECFSSPAISRVDLHDCEQVI